MNEQRMKEVFSDEAFVKSLFALETVEEVQAALKEKGVELSLEEINGIHDRLLVSINENGELSLEQLENVAGGNSLPGLVVKDPIVVKIVTAVNNALRGRW